MFTASCNGRTSIYLVHRPKLNVAVKNKLYEAYRISIFGMDYAKKDMVQGESKAKCPSIQIFHRGATQRVDEMYPEVYQQYHRHRYPTGFDERDQLLMRALGDGHIIYSQYAVPRTGSTNPRSTTFINNAQVMSSLRFRQIKPESCAIVP